MIQLEGNIWDCWERRRAELALTKRWQLAGLFRGHEGPGFRKASRKVLYTGKATAGPFEPTALDNDYFGCNHGAFWSFARRLSRLVGGDPEELGHVAWSNLCKIGTSHGNPGDDLVQAQADLAVHTLRQEWLELTPTLVVCVAEGYQEQLVYRAMDVVQGEKDGFEAVHTSAGVYWRRPALGYKPAFLWMKHPQGKPREYIEQAELIAEQMLAG